MTTITIVPELEQKTLMYKAICGNQETSGLTPGQALDLMEEGVVDCSEYAICENLIYPVLKEVWKAYSEYFVLWGHRSLNYEEKL